MALNYNTIQALVNRHYLPALFNQIFTDNHYLMRSLKEKAKTYNERKIVTALEYAKATTIGFTARHGTVTLTPEEIATSAEWTPKMLTGSLTIALEDELENRSEESIKNFLQTKTNDLRRAIEEFWGDYIFTRGVAVADADGWNTLDHLVNDDASQAVGSVPASGAVPTWWRSNMIDATGADYDNDPSSEADLTDPASDVYLIKLIQRVVAQAKYQSGENPTVIMLGQYLWDLLEFIMDPQKTGSKMNAKAADLGFTALDFRGIPIVADADMVVRQTGDTDGRIYALNDKYLYFFFNAGAKFTARPFVDAANGNSKSSLVNAYGNFVCTNRRAQACIENVYCPQGYAA